MKKKDKKRNVILIAIFIAVALVVLSQSNFTSNSFSSVNLNNYDANQNSIYNMHVDFKKISLREFVITSTKGNYNAGEDIVLEDYQDIDASCQTSLRANFILKKGNNFLDDHYEVIMPTSYATMFYRVSFPGSQTKYWETGTYTVESTWYCDGQKLNINGIISPSVSVSSSANFNIIVLQNPPPAECPIRSSCGVGYELTNPDTVNCYCKRLWTPNNGICESGETPSLSPNDCQIDINSCEPDEIIIDNVCIDKISICVEQGGTKNCSNTGVGNGGGGGGDGDGGDGKTSNPYLILILAVIGGILIYMGYKKNGKKR